jgi:hypothetical protein
VDNLIKKHILLISPESWDHLFVSKHNYSVELANHGNVVYFLNPPSDRYQIRQSIFKNVYIVDYTPFVKGLRFLPRRVQLFFLRQKYRRLERLAGKSFDIVWSFDNSVFFDFSFLPKHVVKINHIVDFSQNFQFERAARTADICFGVSQNIVTKQRQFNKESYLIKHAIHTNHQRQDVNLVGDNTIKAVYAGNLDSQYIDHDSLRSLTENYPQIDFIFIGAGGGKLPRSNNVFPIGRIENHLLLNYLEKADILLLLYDWKRFPDQLTNAHKVLEYLYAGKVIVSSFISDYEDRRNLLEMEDDRRTVLQVFEHVIQNLDMLNGDHRVRERTSFAIRNTYKDRVEEIAKHLKRIGK